jgi:hypothetical protein
MTESKATNAGGAYAVEYYYKVRWGYADEFLELFMRNHYPVLERQLATGRIVEFCLDRPRYHAPEEARWDLRVTILFRDVLAAHDSEHEAPIIRDLYPDQATFRREERRRFEILESHWDTPVVRVETRRAGR